MNEFVDMHVHSKFSIDGMSTMEDYCLIAGKTGTRVICFTEHVDFNSAEKNLSIVKDNRKQNFVVDDYFREINRLRKKYGSLTLLSGIEFSEPSLFPEEFALYSSYPFDCITAGIHHCYNSVFPGAGNLSVSKAIYEYYQIMQKTVELGGFQVLAHLDFTAYFAPPFIACFGAAVYFLIFGSDFSPLQSAFAIQESIISTSELLKTLCILIPLAIIVNPIMGMIQCFGEELGWRGYLLPKIGEKLSPLSASVFTGVIWGLWHAPIIAMGYNYGTNNPIAGIFAMTVFCTVLGIISGFLTYKVRSIWPAVLFHASINGMDRCEYYHAWEHLFSGLRAP